jgi:hypothetical protein
MLCNNAAWHILFKRAQIVVILALGKGPAATLATSGGQLGSKVKKTVV